ncbi:Mad3/BUB1 homology region 1 [Phascolomyces articulosus]|uniref:Mad3/BUB1 homology region 1 n=1 Tax=Phascolomyces articulosus TaxID=60185 RepID=A0AAD5PEC7_9FUNG|nr:Mad3/BUB1 homology region 1 [Phascolomyces articulosus]
MMRMRMMMEVDDPLNISEHQLQEHLKQVKEEKEKDDHHRSLFTLLHDITLRFENDRRYWNDARYIRIWLQYASFFHDPSWVYQHMLQKQIGEYVGAFYQNAADYYEHQHR